MSKSSAKAAAKNNDSLSSKVLAFAKSIEPSEAYFSSLHNIDGKIVKRPIPVRVEGVRGQISPKTPGKKKAGGANPQFLEVARMPADSDQLHIHFSLRVMPSALKPHSTDSMDVFNNYVDLVSKYVELGGMSYLASYYLENIANARFLSQTRRLLDDGVVKISTPNTIVEFDPFKFDLDVPGGTAAMKQALISGTPADVDAMVQDFADGLSSKSVYIHVEFTGTVPAGTELRPSQLYAKQDIFRSDSFYDEHTNADTRGSLTKHLAKRPVKDPVTGNVVYMAAFTPQKVGAMLRTIDRWHGKLNSQPVSVNPYAGHHESDTPLRFREGKNGENVNDFYHIAGKPELIWNELNAAATAEQLNGDIHFFMANLVRGGMFG